LPTTSQVDLSETGTDISTVLKYSKITADENWTWADENTATSPEARNVTPHETFTEKSRKEHGLAAWVVHSSS
jgi:hypothetical protein